jgi:hypothetical protein
MFYYSIREIEIKLQEYGLPPLDVVILDKSFPDSIWNISKKYCKAEVDTYLQTHRQYTNFSIPLSSLFGCQIVRLDVGAEIEIIVLVNNHEYIFKLDNIFGLCTDGLLTTFNRVFDITHGISKLISYKEESYINIDKVTKLPIENKQITLSFCLITNVGKSCIGIIEDKILVDNFTGILNVYLDTE